MKDKSTIVMKFGGAAVSAPERFQEIAQLITDRKMNDQRVIAVVSAMGNQTDELIQLAKKVHPNPPRRELDMLISVGERISISLLAMALDTKKIKAISYTGSQSGIITTHEHANAKVIDVRPYRIQKSLSEGHVVIVAGFQGVSLKGEITTLGRGGSDTSAVALAAAMNAFCVEFYKDVGGIYSMDPKTNQHSDQYLEMTYDQVLNLASSPLSKASVIMAKLNSIPLHVQSFEGKEIGTWVRDTQQLKSETAVYDVHTQFT